MKNVLLLLLLFFILTEKLVAQYHLIKVWETDSILKVPESVLYSPEHMVLFVSNIDGAKPWEKDGKGSIGKLDLDGKIIAVDWIAGLNAPKGMGLFKNKLYVADITEIVVIDIANAKIIQKIPIANAQRLNDIAIDKKGTIYVSDSKTQKIHQIKKGVATVLLDSLNYPNGLYISNNGFYFLDDGSLCRMDKNKKTTLISKGMEGGTDGIEKVGNEAFLVSCWEGAIWFVDTKGNKELLLDSRNQKINSADIGYDPKNKIVFVPTFWKNKVVAYQLQKRDKNIEIENINLFDKSKNRKIPVAVYKPKLGQYSQKLKIVIFSHGYGGNMGGDNIAYSYLTDFLASKGYFVASIQHELSTDSLMPLEGNAQILRRPFWERGTDNILFVINELKKSNPELDFKHITLIGHSNGGDMSALFAEKYPNIIEKIITLDNTKKPVPKTSFPKIYTIRSSDVVADEGVLPSLEEQNKYSIKIIKLLNTKHRDMDDDATLKQRNEINELVLKFIKE
jgi:hypothetical protein